MRVKSRVVRVARKVGNLRSLAISKNAFRLEDIGWKYASLPRELQQSQYCRGHCRQCWADFLRIGNTNDWNLRLVVSILGLLFEKVRDAALLEIIDEFRNNHEAWNLNCFIDNYVSQSCNAVCIQPYFFIDINLLLPKRIFLCRNKNKFETSTFKNHSRIKTVDKKYYKTQ